MKGLVFAGVALLPVMSAAAEMKSAAADTKAAAADAGSTSLRGRLISHYSNLVSRGLDTGIVGSRRPSEPAPL